MFFNKIFNFENCPNLNIFSNMIILLKYSLLILHFANALELPDLLTFDNLHNESCFNDYNCPEEMRCKVCLF